MAIINDCITGKSTTPTGAMIRCIVRHHSQSDSN